MWRHCYRISARFCSSPKFEIRRASINQHSYTRTHDYFASSIQPVILNWCLGFMLRGAIDTGLFDAIPNDNYISVDSICTACNTSFDITYRSLRYMASMGYTKEIEIDNKSGYFVHTLESRDLCKDGNAYNTLKLIIDPLSATARFKFDEYLKGRYGGNTYEELTGQSFNNRFNTDIETRKVLFGLMREISLNSAEPPLIENKHFDFAKYKKVVDIGGGIGDVIYNICDKNKDIEGIVFEQKQMVNYLKEHWSHVKAMRFVEGDFFNESDVVKCCAECDVAILKCITHCFNDEKCRCILNNIRKGFGNNQHKVLLICDIIMSEELNDYLDLGYKLSDQLMDFAYNGKERTLSEFDALLLDSGFKRLDNYPKPFAKVSINAYKPITKD